MSGTNLQYFNLELGAFRAGNFRALDLASTGAYSAAFGFHTQAVAPGSFAFGIDGSETTIRSLGIGSMAGGVTSTLGRNHIVAHGDASTAIGSTENNGTILTGRNAVGSEASGLATGLGATIRTGISDQVGWNAAGAFAKGVARAGELHQAAAEGTVAFGRACEANAPYSGALAYMPGSFAFSSFLSNPKGDGQLVIVSAQGQSEGIIDPEDPSLFDVRTRFVLSDGSYPTLPFDGTAIVEVVVTGSDGTSARLRFDVTRSGSIYTASELELIYGSLPPGVVARSVGSADGIEGFTLELLQTNVTPINGQLTVPKYIATFEIRMIAAGGNVVDFNQPLNISKTGQYNFLGSMVRYDINILNPADNDAPATNVSLLDPLPSNFSWMVQSQQGLQEHVLLLEIN